MKRIYNSETSWKKASVRKPISPERFFSKLYWLDGRPLMIEPYRMDIFNRALYEFDADGRRVHNLVVTGRGKKNYKTFDRILAAVFYLLAWRTAAGNDCYLLDNDEGQSADALDLAKKFIEANPMLKEALVIKANVIERRDRKGFLKILPAGDTVGSHGKTYLFCGFGEIHGYRNWDVIEAMQLDPHRTDAMMWIESYDSLYHRKGAPLYDLMQRGFAGTDKRMLFSWYSANKCTDPKFAEMPAEQRANPSMLSWESGDYLEQQKSRLPSHNYRRLHLNVGGQPEGAAFSGQQIDRAIERGVCVRPPMPGVTYSFFFDGSVGTNDDEILGIAHPEGDRIVLDLVVSQQGRPPFDPIKVISQFAEIVRRYHGSRVVGDRLAFNIFENAWRAEKITYTMSDLTAHQLYEQVQVLFNTERVALIDHSTVEGQFLSLIWRGGKIDHPNGEHDDHANAASGAIYFASKKTPQYRGFPTGVGRSIFAGNADAMTLPFSGRGGRLSVGIPVAGGPGYQRDDDD
jgi:hypothetical protein